MPTIPTSISFWILAAISGFVKCLKGREGPGYHLRQVKQEEGGKKKKCPADSQSNQEKTTCITFFKVWSNFNNGHQDSYHQKRPVKPGKDNLYYFFRVWSNFYNGHQDNCHQKCPVKPGKDNLYYFFAKYGPTSTMVIRISIIKNAQSNQEKTICITFFKI